MTTGLIAKLTAHGPVISRRVMDEMYKDPFWMDRYGERGRGHANEDSDFHIKYLLSALQENDTALFTTYARWLRDLLCARGMCSLHLADNFARLATAITHEGWDGHSKAVAILFAGADCLVHQEGDASIVDAARQSHMSVVVQSVMATHPKADRARLSADTECLLSYLADGLAADAERLPAYATWLARSYEKRKIARGELVSLLAAIAALPALPARAREIIEAQRAAQESA